MPGTPRFPVGFHECTLEEVAAELGVSRQFVQRLERAALDKLQTALEARGITCFDDFELDDYDDPDCAVEPPDAANYGDGFAS